MTKYCGFIAIVGRPNVGKSTILNSLVGEKITITAAKAQTTRHIVRGVLTIGDKQSVFIDTPGIHSNTTKNIFSKALNKTAISAINDVDLVLFVVDSNKWNQGDRLVLEQLKHCSAPIYLIINKCDLITNKQNILPLIANLAKLYDFAEIIPISAKSNLQIDSLTKLIMERLPVGEHYYTDQQITDQPLNLRIAEIIREKLTRNLNQEIPYAVAIEIQSIQEQENHTDINALIWVEREGQRRIIIGKQGSNLKTVGIQARTDLEKLIKCKVNLQLWVKIRNNWTNDNNFLAQFGYKDFD